MVVGEQIHIQAYKADGNLYRRWRATIESVQADSIIAITPAYSLVEDRVKGDWTSQYILRAYYWFEKPYNLVEVFESDGRAIEIYLNIASTQSYHDRVVEYTDYGLDVYRRLPGSANLFDQDEFHQAAVKYGYTREFQEHFLGVAQQVLALADRWKPGMVPLT